MSNFLVAGYGTFITLLLLATLIPTFVVLCHSGARIGRISKIRSSIIFISFFIPCSLLSAYRLYCMLNTSKHFIEWIGIKYNANTDIVRYYQWFFIEKTFECFKKGSCYNEIYFITIIVVGCLIFILSFIVACYFVIRFYEYDKCYFKSFCWILWFIISNILFTIILSIILTFFPFATYYSSFKLFVALSDPENQVNCCKGICEESKKMARQNYQKHDNNKFISTTECITKSCTSTFARIQFVSSTINTIIVLLKSPTHILNSYNNSNNNNNINTDITKLFLYCWIAEGIVIFWFATLETCVTKTIIFIETMNNWISVGITVVESDYHLSQPVNNESQIIDLTQPVNNDSQIIELNQPINNEMQIELSHQENSLLETQIGRIVIIRQIIVIWIHYFRNNQ